MRGLKAVLRVCSHLTMGLYECDEALQTLFETKLVQKRASCSTLQHAMG